MLKTLVATIAALGISAPSMAAPSYLNRQHTRLWNTLESAGVSMHLNPSSLCNKPDAPMGIYVYDQRYGSLIGICQDNRTPTGEQVAWSDNDLDTLRHEAMHFIQDCVDYRIDGRLSPYFDGTGPSPGTLTHQDVIERLGLTRALNIAYSYQERGADRLTIQLEHEAFAIAAYAQADQISDKIRQVCPRK